MINHVNVLGDLSLVFPHFPFVMSALILVFDYKVIALDVCVGDIAFYYILFV